MKRPFLLMTAGSFLMAAVAPGAETPRISFALSEAID